jgi:hypothetical protein
MRSSSGWIVTVAAVLATLPLATTPAEGQAGISKAAAKAPKGQPTPRRADGKVDFSGVYHAPGYGPGDPRSATGENTAHNIARDLKPGDVPMQPWAEKLQKERLANLSKDDPEGLCLPMGTPRVNPYPWKIVQTGKLFLILYEGNVHSYRQVFIDGRPHDKNVEDTWWGDSIGHWEGDTMVVDTVGLNDKAWLDATGHPRTQKAHIVERFTRPELGKVVIEITIDDPGAYTRPWKVTEVAQLAPGWEIQENICNENQDEHGNNLDVQHLVGK